MEFSTEITFSVLNNSSSSWRLLVVEVFKAASGSVGTVTGGWACLGRNSSQYLGSLIKLTRGFIEVGVVEFEGDSATIAVEFGDEALVGLGLKLSAQLTARFTLSGLTAAAVFT